MKGALLLICAVVASINAQAQCGCGCSSPPRPLPLCPRPPPPPRPLPPCPRPIPLPTPCSPPLPICPRPLPPCPRPQPPCQRPQPPCLAPAPVIEVCDYNQAVLPFIQAPLLQPPVLQAPILQQPLVTYEVPPYSAVGLPSCNCPAPPSLPVSQLYPSFPDLPTILNAGLGLSPCLGGIADLAPVSPIGLINPFLPAASPISALAPTVSSLYPPINPCGCGCQYLKKIPIPPPFI